MRRFSFALLFLLTVGLSGCAMQETAGPAANVAGGMIQGIVHGGQQPVTGVTVAIYSMIGSGYGAAAVKLASTKTDAYGSFAFGGTGTTYTCTYGNMPLYIAATGSGTSSPANSNLVLAAALGPCSTAQSEVVSINEVTTAAFAFAYAQFMSSAMGSSAEPMAVGGLCTSCAAGTYNRGLVHAWYAYNQLVSNATGAANAGSTAGGLTVTTESAKLYSVANALATCVNSTGETSTSETGTNCGKLFSDVNAPGGTRAYDTLQAALQVALYPNYNVATVYGLGSPTSPFAGQGSAPNDWTMAVAYTSSTLGLGISAGTMTNLDVDISGNVWFPSNAAGAVGVASFSPSTGSFSTAVGVTGMVYPQYVAIDTSSPAYAWVTDLASAHVVGASTTSAASTKLTGPANYYYGGGPIADFSGNLLVIAGAFGTSWTPFTLNAGHTGINQPGSGYFNEEPNGMVEDSPGDIRNYITSQTGGQCNMDDLVSGLGNGDEVYVPAGDGSCVAGGILFVGVGPSFPDDFIVTSEGQICDYATGSCASVGGLNNARGIALDGADNFWMANAGNSSIVEGALDIGTLENDYVVVVNPVGNYLHGTGNGGTMTTPYGIAVDGSGNVWVSNASCVATTSTRCAASGFTLTEVIGAATPAITPYALQMNTETNAPPTN